MKKIVLICGLIAGFISTLGFLITMIFGGDTLNFEIGMWLGYASMLLGFSLIFVGVHQYRKHYLGGTISFGKAFLVGLYITLIASTVYVLIWLVYYYNFALDFWDRYGEYARVKMIESGASDAEMAAQSAQMQEYKDFYKNPVMVFFFTYLEIVPVGLLLSLVAALVMKKRTPAAGEAVA